MRAALSVINPWFVLAWAALVMLSAFGLIHIRNATEMVGWSVYVATFATILAGKNYDRRGKNTRLAAS
jgi:hypothetical protein